MSKTAISILQETVAKCGASLPVYTEICMAGIYQNKFIIQVTWNGYKVKGDGTSKKEAKQNAAKEMIRLLSSQTSLQSEPTPFSSIKVTAQDEAPITSNSAVQSLTEKLITTSISLESAFLNYVGLLQVNIS